VLGRETFEDIWKEYFRLNYKVFRGKFDLYIYFTERGLSLLKNSGKLGYILPNTILANVNATSLREFILNSSLIETIQTFDNMVFKNAQVESVVIVIKKEPNVRELLTDHQVEIARGTIHKIQQQKFNQTPNFKFNVSIDTNEESLLTKLTAVSKRLREMSDICIGIQLGGSSGRDKKESFLSKKKINDTYKKVLDGKNINYYSIEWSGMYVRYGNWLHRKREEKYFLNQKIVIRQIGSTPIATYDDDKFYTLNTIYNVLIKDKSYSSKYVLGIMNSALGKWYWRKENSDFKTLFPKIKKEQLESIPIRTIDFTNPDDKAMHDQMVQLVERMLDLHKKKHHAKTDSERELFEHQIKATDREIDQLVYRLYGVAETEQKIIEGTKHGD
jgi:hypothetical protein